MKYHLMHIGALGSYPVLTGVSPTDDAVLLQSLDDIYRKLRHGHGIYYTTLICEIDDNGLMNERSIKRIEEARKALLRT